MVQVNIDMAMTILANTTNPKGKSKKKYCMTFYLREVVQSAINEQGISLRGPQKNLGRRVFKVFDV
mgnify:CR=1 FL=1